MNNNNTKTTYYIVKVNKNRENFLCQSFSDKEKALDEMESMRIWHGWELKLIDTLDDLQDKKTLLTNKNIMNTINEKMVAGVKQYMNEAPVDFDIDITGYIYGDCDWETLRGRIDQAINESEIIYYSEAIKFLQENDPSLEDSLWIASEYGMELDDLSSETLASLLYQRMLMEEWGEIVDDLEEIIESIYNN